MARTFNQTPEYCIETIDLTHKFSESETALNRVNLQVIDGSIYGFLGPNGAGKTTTLKLILGLLNNRAKSRFSSIRLKRIASKLCAASVR